MNELLYGFYGTRIYLPLSGLSRRWRRRRQLKKGKQGRFLQQVKLPEISWRDCTPNRTARIWEHDKANGNIRISELGVIGLLAQGCEAHSKLFEIGSFDGRTTLNLAFSSPMSCEVHTLDLAPEMDTAFELARGERHMVEKEKSGARIDKYRDSHAEVTQRIHQHFGDSAAFDYSPFENACSLVFVDGSHAYDYALSDTRAAMRMIRPGGVIIWHDYGIWEGVTRALEELEEKENLGLKNIAGTSLVYWRKSA